MARQKKTLDAASVRTLGDSDVRFWSDLQQRQSDDQALIEREGKASKTEHDDDDTWQTFSNDGKVIVEKGASMLAGTKLRVSVPLPAGVGDPRADQQLRLSVQMVEDASRFMWEEFNRRHQQGLNNNLEYDLWKFFLLRGWLAGRILRNPNEEDFFWDLLIADPITVFPRFAGKKLVRVSHVYWASKAEVEGDFYEDEDPPEWLEALNDDDLVKIYAYYDSTQMAVTSDKSGDEWIKEPVDHGLVDENERPVVPWVIRTARGAPYRSTENQQAGYQKWVGESILGLVRDQIENKDQVLAILHDAVDRANEPPMFIFSNAQGRIQIDTRAAARNFLAPTDKVQEVKFGASIQDLSALGSEYQKMIDKGSIDPILFGQGDPGDTGVLANAKAGSARDTFRPYILSMQDFKSTITRYALMYFKREGTPFGIIHTDRSSGMRMQGYQFSPDHVHDAGTHVEFEYRNFTPQDEMQLANMVTLLVRDGVFGLDWARDRMGADNPDAENTKVLSDQAYKDPAVVKIASLFSILGMLQGKNFTLADLAQAVQMVNGMAGGTGGGAANPAAPPGQPGSGMAPPAAPGLPSPDLLPPEYLARGQGQGTVPLGPPGSAPPGGPTGQNLQQIPLPIGI